MTRPASFKPIMVMGVRFRSMTSRAPGSSSSRMASASSTTERRIASVRRLVAERKSPAHSGKS